MSPPSPASDSLKTSGKAADENFSDQPADSHHTSCQSEPPRDWIEILLLDEFGDPVPAEPYQVLQKGKDPREGRLDADGYAREEELVAGEARVVFPEREALWFLPEPDKKPPPRKPSRQSAAVITGADWVEIVLVDEYGNPVADEPYLVRSHDGSIAAQGRLDADGYAKANGVSPGSCRIVFPDRDPGWWKPSRERPEPEKKKPPAVIPAAISAAWVEIELLDEYGRPVPDEPFLVKNADGGIAADGRLDMDGLAKAFVAAPGKCRVIFPERDPGWWKPSKERPEPEKKKPPAAMPAAISAAWVEIELLDEYGDPVAEEPFLVKNGDGSVAARGNLDMDGRAKAFVTEPGKYKIVFAERDPGWWKPSKERPEPEKKKPPAAIPAAISAAWLEIELLDEYGDPVAEEPFLVKNGDGSIAARGNLDMDGRAKAFVSAAGKYKIVFPERDPGWWKPSRERPEPKKEKPAKSKPAAMPAAAWVEIELLDEYGAPVPEEPFVIRDAEGNTAARGELDESGFKRVTGLMPGDYSVVFPMRDPGWWKKTRTRPKPKKQAA